MPNRSTTRLARSAPTATPGRERKDKGAERKPLDPVPPIATPDPRKRDGAGNLTWDDEEGR